MYFLNLMESLHLLSNKKVAFFIDMDGVVADYRFGEGKDIKDNVPGLYLNKRPIMTIIRNIQTIIENSDCEFYIISSCLFKEQAIEKIKWLDKYMPFIKEKNKIILISSDFESRKKLKINKLKYYIYNKKLEKIVFIDDTHEILFLAIKELGDKVLPFHIITLID